MLACVICIYRFMCMFCGAYTHRVFFFVNDTATTEIYTYGHTLSLHDAVPIAICSRAVYSARAMLSGAGSPRTRRSSARKRSEEHTSELQSLMRISYAVFCLKKKNNKIEIGHDSYTNITANLKYTIQAANIQ